jgi:enoyl-CoA hydratase/carnithine racemase
MPEIIFETRGAALVATFNRPDKLNALTYGMHSLIAEAIDRANADDAIRAVIFTATGRGFCAGTDLSSGFGRLSEKQAPASDTHAVPPQDKGGVLALRLFDCRKPLIAAVNGIAAGMGAALTLAMDYRIGTPATRYIFPYVKRGIAPESCSSWFLPRLVGVARALDWMQSARNIDAGEALEAGLLSEVVDESELLERALEIVNRLSAGTSPLAVALTRRLIWQGMVASHPMEAHRHESRALVTMARSGDPAEGARAFMEKRPPEFRGSVGEGLRSPFPGWEIPPYA